MRLGRPSPEREREIRSTILDLVNAEPPGLTFNHLVEAAEKHRISRPTLWRHLMRFVKLGVVVHEGKHYRRTPRTKSDKIPRFYLESEDMTMEDEAPARFSLGLGGNAVLDTWSTEKPIIDLKPELLSFLLNFSLTTAMSSYIALLETVRDAPNPTAARDLSAIVLEMDVTRPLLGMIRAVYENRDKVSIKDLDGKKLGVTVRLGTMPPKAKMKKVFFERQAPE